MGNCIVAAYGNYTEESAYAEIYQESQTYARCTRDSPNVLTVRGKGFIFNSTPPLDPSILRPLSPKEFQAAVVYVNRTLAKGMDGRPRAFLSSQEQARRAHMRRCVEAAVKNLNANLGESARYRWELTVGETHRHRVDAQTTVNWVETNLHVVFSSSPPPAVASALVVAEPFHATDAAKLEQQPRNGLVADLARLAQLRSNGALTEEEFEAAKVALLASAAEPEAESDSDLQDFDLGF